MDVCYNIILLWMKEVNSSLFHVQFMYFTWIVNYLGQFWRSLQGNPELKSNISSGDFHIEIYWNVRSTILAQSSLWKKYLFKVNNKDCGTSFADFALVSVLLKFKQVVTCNVETSSNQNCVQSWPKRFLNNTFNVFRVTEIALRICPIERLFWVISLNSQVSTSDRDRSQESCRPSVTLFKTDLRFRCFNVYLRNFQNRSPWLLLMLMFKIQNNVMIYYWV